MLNFISTYAFNHFRQSLVVEIRSNEQKKAPEKLTYIQQLPNTTGVSSPKHIAVQIPVGSFV